MIMTSIIYDCVINFIEKLLKYFIELYYVNLLRILMLIHFSRKIQICLSYNLILRTI